MTAVFFATQQDFRKWLEENHKTETELLVGYYKIGTGKPSITWSQSVDEALCFGWIDGIRNSIDTESYCNRFTPRRKTSIWSAVNIAKVEDLIKKGLMQKAGLDAYALRKDSKSKIYSFESEQKELSIDFVNQFKVNVVAWNYFNTLSPSYKKTVIHWILSAKKEETQKMRLEKLIKACEIHKRVL